MMAFESNMADERLNREEDVFFCDGHQARFLIGSLLVDRMSSVPEMLKLPFWLPSLRTMAKAARKGMLTEEQLERCGLQKEFVEDRLLLFNPAFREGSVRYKLGDALVEGLTSFKGALRLPSRLLRIIYEERGKGRASARLSSHPFPRLPNAHPRREPEDDVLPDLDEPVETEPGLLEEAEHAQAHRLWLEDALERLGSKNTGVGLEHYASRIVDAIPPAELKNCLAAFEGRGDLAGLQMIADVVDKRRLAPNARAYLARVLAVLRCIEDGIDVGEKAGKPAYDPDFAKLLYAVHMRGPYIVNGYVSRTHTILKVLRKLGYEPEAVTRLGFPNDLARFRRERIPLRERIEGTDFLALPDDAGGQLLRPVDELIRAYADALAKLACERRAFAIHAASNYVNGLAAIIAARRLGISSIYEVRGIWEITQASHDRTYQYTRKFELQRRLENLAVQSADRVITISEPLKEFVISQGADPENTFVVPNGVDVTAFAPTRRNEDLARKVGLGKDEIIIGYIGSIVRYEGLDLLLRAVAGLPADMRHNMRVLIVGDGAALPRLKELAGDLGIDDLCVFPGRVPREEVKHWYSLIDITPFPRLSLPVTELVPPLKPYEALAMGKAVIVSSVKALASEIDNGRTGFVFEKNDVNDLASKLSLLVEDSHLRKKLSREGREWVVRERSIEALGRHMERVYSSLGH